MSLRPLAVFACLGALLFFGKRALLGEEQVARPLLEVRVPAGAPAAEVQRRVERAALVQYAIDGGALTSDPLVLRELAHNFPTQRGAGTLDPKGELARELVRIDPVLQERLAWHGEQLLRARVAVGEPSEAALSAYLTRSAARYREPERFTLTHILVSADRWGDELDTQVARVQAALQGGAFEELVQRLSDPSILPRTFSQVSRAELDGSFGPGFAAALPALAPGETSGPLRSSYGTHFVFVQARTKGRLPTLDAVRARVRADYLEDERNAAVLREVRSLCARYQPLLVQEAP